jgi:hypothetical protein
MDIEESLNKNGKPDLSTLKSILLDLPTLYASINDKKLSQTLIDGWMVNLFWIFTFLGDAAGLQKVLSQGDITPSLLNRRLWQNFILMRILSSCNQ